MIEIKKKLPYLINFNKIQEIIGADRRCSNHTLLSFGACYDKPLMTWGQTTSIFKEIFGNNDIKLVQTLTTPGSMSSPTVRQFIEEHPKGHYVLYTAGHAMAVHNGHLVDTAQKGISRQKIKDVFQVINRDRQIDAAFEEYLRQYPRNVFTKPKQRKPKYRFSIEDITKILKDYVRNWDEEDLYDEINRTAVFNDFGKIIDDNLYLSKSEMHDVVNIVISKV